MNVFSKPICAFSHFRLNKMVTTTVTKKKEQTKFHEQLYSVFMHFSWIPKNIFKLDFFCCHVAIQRLHNKFYVLCLPFKFILLVRYRKTCYFFCLHCENQLVAKITSCCIYMAKNIRSRYMQFNSRKWITMTKRHKATIQDEEKK